MITADDFLRLIASKPARVIVSTQELTAEGIAIARREGRMLVLDDGLGFVIMPMKLDLGPPAVNLGSGANEPQAK